MNQKPFLPRTIGDDIDRRTIGDTRAGTLVICFLRRQCSSVESGTFLLTFQLILEIQVHPKEMFSGSSRKKSESCRNFETKILYDDIIRGKSRWEASIEVFLLFVKYDFLVIVKKLFLRKEEKKIRES